MNDSDARGEDALGRREADALGRREAEVVFLSCV